MSKHSSSDARPTTDDVGAPVPESSPAQDAPTLPTIGKESGQAVEIGGQKGPEPTRYGDWEKGGRCTDF